MRHFLNFILLLLPVAVFSQVGIGTTTPNTSSLLDITDTSKGLLIPRMTQAQRNAITTPATGLIIYQTNNSPGFYYFNGTIWVSLANSGWSTTGNAGTTPAANKVGTTDNQSFALVTNNTEKVRVTNTGNIGIGTTAPTTKLHLNAAATYNYTQDFSSSSVGNVATATTNNPYCLDSNAGCVAADRWRIETTSYAGCTGCTGNRAVIDYGASTCNQDATLVVKLGAINVNEITLSFDYGYDDYNGTDQFTATLYNETTSSVAATLLNLSTADANANFSNVFTTIPGNTYSLRFRYVATYGSGASVDNISIANTGLLRIQDGFQANGKILVSDANGQAVWQMSSPSTTVDADWTWHTGNTVSDPIYHVGNVFIGTGATTGTQNLKVWNGTTSGTIIEVGSVEYLQDGINEIRVSDIFTPITNAAQDLGSATNRWQNVYAANGTINTSDARLKEDIQPLKYGLKEILKLKPVSFQWKKEQTDAFVIPNNEKETKLGFIAQEVLKVIPEVIVTKDWYADGEKPEKGIQETEAKRLGISYSELIPVTIKAIQEQQTQIDALKETNNNLKAQIEKMEREKK